VLSKKIGFKQAAFQEEGKALGVGKVLSHFTVCGVDRPNHLRDITQDYRNFLRFRKLGEDLL